MHFDGEEKQGPALLTALLLKFGISTRAKKPTIMLAEMPRAFVTRGRHIPSEELGIWLVDSTFRLGPSPGVLMPPVQLQYTPGLLCFDLLPPLRATCVAIAHWDLIRPADRPHLALMGVE